MPVQRKENELRKRSESMQLEEEKNVEKKKEKKESKGEQREHRQ